jgi:hypothetical protein
MTGVPNQSPSSKVASPALTPMRIARVGPPARRFRRSTARCIATAPANASAAPVYDAITASPMVLTSVPPVAAMASRRSVKWARRRLSAAASPMSEVSSVEPTRSVNRMLISPELLTASPLPAPVARP